MKALTDGPVSFDRAAAVMRCDDTRARAWWATCNARDSSCSATSPCSCRDRTKSNQLAMIAAMISLSAASA